MCVNETYSKIRTNKIVWWIYYSERFETGRCFIAIFFSTLL